jgi:hypothetical protein
MSKTLVGGDDETSTGVVAEQTEMYPVSVALAPKYQERRADLGDVLGLTQTQIREAEDTHTDAIRSSGVDPYGLGRAIYDHYVAGEIAAHRGNADVDVQALNEATRRELRETYGAAEADDLLARTAAFVQSHPKLGAILRAHGVGSRADVVAGLVDHVRRVNYRPGKSTLAGA